MTAPALVPATLSITMPALELIEHPDVREGAGTASGEDEPDRALGEPGCQPRHQVPDLRQPLAVHGRHAALIKHLAVRSAQDAHALPLHRHHVSAEPGANCRQPVAEDRCESNEDHGSDHVSDCRHWRQAHPLVMPRAEAATRSVGCRATAWGPRLTTSDTSTSGAVLAAAPRSGTGHGHQPDLGTRGPGKHN